MKPVGSHREWTANGFASKWLSTWLLRPPFRDSLNVQSLVEVSWRLVGSPAFKAVPSWSQGSAWSRFRSSSDRDSSGLIAVERRRGAPATHRLHNLWSSSKSSGWCLQGLALTRERVLVARFCPVLTTWQRGTTNVTVGSGHSSGNDAIDILCYEHPAIVPAGGLRHDPGLPETCHCTVRGGKSDVVSI